MQKFHPSLFRRLRQRQKLFFTGIIPIISLLLVTAVTIYILNNYTKSVDNKTASLLSQAAGGLRGLGAKITPGKTSATPAWDRQHRIYTSGAGTTPLVSEMTPSSPGKEIAYIDADRILFVYSADGTLLATSSAKVTLQYGQAADYAPSAIDLYADRDTQGNPEYDILVPSATSNTPNTTSVFLHAFKLNFASGVYSLVATSSASVVGEGAPFSAAAVDDLDNDGRPEIFVTTKKTTGEASLLGWTWDPATRTFLPLNNVVDPGPVILRVAANSLDGLLEPAIGNITSSDFNDKQVVVAAQTPGNAMQIYVFRKNGLTLTPISAQTAVPYYWFQEQINEIPTGAPGVERMRIGGISLADLNGDARFEVLATTKKRQTGLLNRTGYYAIRAFKHDAASGGGSRLTDKIEVQFGIMDDGQYSNSTVSRPTVGKFEGYDRAISFLSFDRSKGLFSAFFNGTALEWIPNYSPRFTNDYLYQQGLPITCDIKSQVMGNVITLADTDNNGNNELIYLKHDVSNGSANYNYVFLHNADGAAVAFPSCSGTPVEFYDVNTFASFSPSHTGWLIQSYSNVEIADVDGNNTIEALVTYNNRGTVFDGVRLIPLVPTLSVLPYEWPMTGAGPCRQGRSGVVTEPNSGCPSTIAVPYPTPTPIPTPSPTPMSTPSPTPTPIPTPSPTPSPSATCDGIKYYNISGGEIFKTEILPGETVYVACINTVSNGTLDKAHFRVNSGIWIETTNTWPETTEFYIPYTFPTSGPVTSFMFEAEVHVLENNQWY